MLLAQRAAGAQPQRKTGWTRGTRQVADRVLVSSGRRRHPAPARVARPLLGTQAQARPAMLRVMPVRKRTGQMERPRASAAPQLHRQPPHAAARAAAAGAPGAPRVPGPSVRATPSTGGVCTSSHPAATPAHATRPDSRCCRRVRPRPAPPRPARRTWRHWQGTRACRARSQSWWCSTPRSRPPTTDPEALGRPLLSRSHGMQQQGVVVGTATTATIGHAGVRPSAHPPNPRAGAHAGGQAIGAVHARQARPMGARAGSPGGRRAFKVTLLGVAAPPGFAAAGAPAAAAPA